MASHCFFFPFTIDVVVCLTHFFALAGVEEIENRVVPLTTVLWAGVLGLSVYPRRILMVARLAQYFVYPMASRVGGQHGELQTAGPGRGGQAPVPGLQGHAGQGHLPPAQD